MALENKEVERIAKLARLKLTSEEVRLFREQLSEILEYARRLQTINTSEVLLTGKFLSSSTSLRSDIPHSGMKLEDLFHNAPSIEDNQFRVPRILDSD